MDNITNFKNPVYFLPVKTSLEYCTIILFTNGRKIKLTRNNQGFVGPASYKTPRHYVILRKENAFEYIQLQPEISERSVTIVDCLR